MTRRIAYDTQPCTRCGGTGHYSYNPKDGTVCFKCRGATTHLTKDGIKAKEAVDALRAATLTIRADEVTVGMRINYQGMKGFATVVEIAEGPKSKRGDEDWVTHLAFTFKNGRGYGPRPDTPVMRMHTPEEWATFEALAETLKGVTVIEVEGKPAVTFEAAPF